MSANASLFIGSDGAPTGGILSIKVQAGSPMSGCIKGWLSLGDLPNNSLGNVTGDKLANIGISHLNTGSALSINFMGSTVRGDMTVNSYSIQSFRGGF